MEGVVIAHKDVEAGEILFSSVSAHSLAGSSGAGVIRQERDFEAAEMAKECCLQDRHFS